MRKMKHDNGDLSFRFGHDEIVIHKRYAALSMVNDLMIGLWFLIGSFCFFYEGATLIVGTWLFVIGSAQLLIRPGIRLARSIHLNHLPSNGTQDF
ncbi:YrhK family protein [Larsenimonas suaedae]|uniref:YrhK family protein n=1 Tax=Larsenimonas suaedae TaxID=1851019 RepID=A0ABU1GUV4_9GAMM|nr:YrhK family protein [Larsenimonas suaedae]MCM2971098.1 YrhK family protein [Larsenimonas suaedae]MDR5895807.1 YrhK family protein [Larsenimonas suaedae]